MASEYDLSPKEFLKPYQPKFRDAVRAWQGLSAEDKEYYNTLGNRLSPPLPGYNYFLSLYLRDKL